MAAEVLGPFDDFIASIRTKSSRKSVGVALRAVTKTMGLGSPYELKVVEPKTWAGFVAKHLERGYAPRTVSYHVQVVRRWLRYLSDAELMGSVEKHMKVLKFHLPPSEELAGRALTEDEIVKLIAFPLTSRKRRLCYAFFWLGITISARKSELLELLLTDYDPTNHRLLIRDAKNLSERWLYVAEPVRLAIALHRMDCDPTCPYLLQSGRGRRVDDSTPGLLLRDMARACGVQYFSPHDLRRTVATLMLDRGEDIFTVMRIMGHTSPKTTARYDRRPVKIRDRAIKKLASSLLEARPDLLPDIHALMLGQGPTQVEEEKSE